MFDERKKRIDATWIDTEIFESMKIYGKKEITLDDEKRLKEIWKEVAKSNPNYSPVLARIFFFAEMDKLADTISKEISSEEEFGEYIKSLDETIQNGMYETGFATKILKDIKEKK